MKEVALDVIDLPNGRVMCVGTNRMVVPDGAPHVRVVEMRLPPMELDPVASLTIVADQGVGTVFGVYSLKFGYVNNGAETQVAVNATNLQSGEPSNFDFFCSYVVVGKRLKQK